MRPSPRLCLSTSPSTLKATAKATSSGSSSKALIRKIEGTEDKGELNKSSGLTPRAVSTASKARFSNCFCCSGNFSRMALAKKELSFLAVSRSEEMSLNSSAHTEYSRDKNRLNRVAILISAILIKFKYPYPYPWKWEAIKSEEKESDHDIH